MSACGYPTNIILSPPTSFFLHASSFAGGRDYFYNVTACTFDLWNHSWLEACLNNSVSPKRQENLTALEYSDGGSAKNQLIGLSSAFSYSAHAADGVCVLMDSDVDAQRREHVGSC